MNQTHYWNEAAEKKEFTTPFQAEEFESYVAKDKRILDVGCGYGRTLDQLYQLGYRNLSGLDFARAMILRGRRQFPYLDLQVMEEGKIDLPDESVDAVILFAVLTCISDNDRQTLLLQEIRRVLKPSGILYVNDFLLNTDERNQNRYRAYQEKRGQKEICHPYGVFELPEGAVCRHHDEAWMRHLLSGFETLCYEPLTFTTMNGNQSNGFYFIGKK